MPSPILTAAGQQASLQLGSSEYLSGTLGTAPTFPFEEVTGVVSSAVLTGEDWIQVSEQSVTFICGTTLISGNDYYSLPPANLQVTLPASYSVLYAHKTASGLSAYSTTIDLLPTSSASTAGEALAYAQNSITGVYIPLAVLSGDNNGNQTLEWSVSQNAAYSAPILNQLVLVGNFEQNAKQFLTSQFTALYNDLTSFASWSTGWINTPFQANFSVPNITNYVNPINWGGEGVPGVQYQGNSINVNCFTRTLSFCPIGLVWGTEANNGNTSAWTGWSDAFNAPLVYVQAHGGLESQFQTLIPNFSSYTGTNYYYAPSVDLGLQGALVTTVGNNNGPGATYWQKTLIWSSSDGNLYTHVGASLERDLGVPYSLVIPAGISIRLINGDTGEEVVAMPANPLENPTFNSAWQGGGTTTPSYSPTTTTTTTTNSPSNSTSSTPTPSSTTGSTGSSSDTTSNSGSNSNSGSTSSTPTPSTSTPASTTPEPAYTLSQLNYVSDFSSPQKCYLFFSQAGTWGQTQPFYVATGISDGKLTLAKVEASTSDVPQNALKFLVAASPATALTSSQFSFTIQNADTQQYLGGSSANGFGWYSSTGSETQFTTSCAYAGDGFAMNIAWDVTSSKASWFEVNGSFPTGTTNQWTFWAQPSSSTASSAIELTPAEEKEEEKK